MKKFLLAAAASTLLGGCAYYYPPSKDTIAQNGEEERYVPTGSNIPRKKGEGTVMVGTLSKVELESARLNPGTGPVLDAAQQ